VAADRREAGRRGDARKDKEEGAVWWVEEEESTARKAPKAAWAAVAMTGERISGCSRIWEGIKARAVRNERKLRRSGSFLIPYLEHIRPYTDLSRCNGLLTAKTPFKSRCIIM
jgi:hypothetical protein